MEKNCKNAEVRYTAGTRRADSLARCLHTILRDSHKGRAAPIHHGNFEAIIAHLTGNKTQFDIESPPSLAWVKQASVSGHVYLLQALNALNTFFDLGFDLKLAGEEFENVWRRAATSAASGD
jgi:hypothetical protein